MAVNIKDLYRESGNRLKKINIPSQKFSVKNALPHLLSVFLLLVWLCDLGDFLSPEFPLVRRGKAKHSRSGQPAERNQKF